MSRALQKRVTAAKSSGQRRRPAERRDAFAGADIPARRQAAGAVKPVASAIRILRFLSRTGMPARAIQVARELQLNNSTCFNILRTLTSEGVIEFNAQTKSYSVGLGLVKLVDNSLADGKRISAAKPILHETAERFGVTATLWRRIVPDRIVLVAVEHSRSDLRIHMREGQRLPMLMGASGRLATANAGMSKADAQEVFGGLRWARPISFEAYWREVRLAEKRGWAVDDGYFSQGILSVAAPVFNHDGHLEYSVSAVMFRGQRDETGINVLGEELKKCTARLSALLF
jgi:DNA-binding IclR family transcriptional regulator